MTPKKTLKNTGRLDTSCACKTHAKKEDAYCFKRSHPQTAETNYLIFVIMIDMIYTINDMNYMDLLDVFFMFIWYTTFIPIILAALLGHLAETEDFTRFGLR